MNNTILIVEDEEDIAAETDRIVRLRDGIIISDEKVTKKVSV